MNIKNIEKEFKFKEYSNVDWNSIFFYETEPLSEECIEYFIDKVNWNILPIYIKLSESFIEKYKDRLNWRWISEYQTLSESFIEKHKDEVSWYFISEYQSLSEEFIKKYLNRICVDELVVNKKIDYDIRMIFKRYKNI